VGPAAFCGRGGGIIGVRRAQVTSRSARGGAPLRPFFGRPHL